MCVVSMIGDHYSDKWWPSNRPWQNTNPVDFSTLVSNLVSRVELEELRKEVQELRELLIRAKKYDVDNHQPDCEIEDKMKILRLVGDAIGIDLSDVIPKKK